MKKKLEYVKNFIMKIIDYPNLKKLIKIIVLDIL